MQRFKSSIALFWGNYFWWTRKPNNNLNFRRVFFRFFGTVRIVFEKNCLKYCGKFSQQIGAFWCSQIRKCDCWVWNLFTLVSFFSVRLVRVVSMFRPYENDFSRLEPCIGTEVFRHVLHMYFAQSYLTSYGRSIRKRSQCQCTFCGNFHSRFSNPLTDHIYFFVWEAWSDDGCSNLVF